MAWVDESEVLLSVLAFPMGQLQALTPPLETTDQQHQGLTAGHPTLLMKASCLMLLLHSLIPAPANDLLSLETS